MLIGQDSSPSAPPKGLPRAPAVRTTCFGGHRSDSVYCRRVTGVTEAGLPLQNFKMQKGETIIEQYTENL